ncbi:hypothetical protein J3E69DRAFT_147357 [Trichoderma sp. SZMC 28015]
MQPMHDWVGEVSSYRRPSHAMQAMQRHPQRTRGPETDMSFDVQRSKRWCLGRRCWHANERIYKATFKLDQHHTSLRLRSQLRRPQQPTSVNHLAEPTATSRSGGSFVLRQSVVAISLAVPDTANTRSPSDPTNGAVPSAAMPPERGPFPPS